MSKWTESPAYWLNKWITDELRNEEIIPELTDYVTEVDTNDAFDDDGAIIDVPFLSPGGQQAEAMTTIANGVFTRLPIGVYTVSQTGGHDQPWNKYGQVSYIFYFSEVDKLLEISNFIHDLTNREDWSATDINYFFRTDNNFPYDFKTVCYDNGVGPYPPQNEGGPYRFLVVISYSAVYEGLNRAFDYDAVIGEGRI